MFDECEADSARDTLTGLSSVSLTTFADPLRNSSFLEAPGEICVMVVLVEAKRQDRRRKRAWNLIADQWLEGYGHENVQNMSFADKNNLLWNAHISILITYLEMRYQASVKTAFSLGRGAGEGVLGMKLNCIFGHSVGKYLLIIFKNPIFLLAMQCLLTKV